MKEIHFTNTKPKYWFGDRTIIAIGLSDELTTTETIYGIKYCLDSNDWMYCFVLVDYSPCVNAGDSLVDSLSSRLH